MSLLARLAAALAVLRARSPASLPALPALPKVPIPAPLGDLAAQRALLQVQAERHDKARTDALAEIARIDEARDTPARRARL